MLGLSSTSFLCGSDNANDAVVPPMFFGGQILLIAVHRRYSTLKNLNLELFLLELESFGRYLARPARTHRPGKFYEFVNVSHLLVLHES